MKFVYIDQVIHLIHTGHTSGQRVKFVAPITIGDSKTGKVIWKVTKRDVIDLLEAHHCAVRGGIVDGTSKNNIWICKMNDYVIEEESGGIKCWVHFLINSGDLIEHIYFPGGYNTDMKIYKRYIYVIFNSSLVMIIKGWLGIPLGSSFGKPHGKNSMEWMHCYQIVLYLVLNYFVLIHCSSLSISTRFIFKGLLDYMKMPEVKERMDGYIVQQTPFFEAVSYLQG